MTLTLTADDLLVEITIMDTMAVTAETTEAVLVVDDDITLFAVSPLFGTITQQHPEMSS